MKRSKSPSQENSDDSEEFRRKRSKYTKSTKDCPISFLDLILNQSNLYKVRNLSNGVELLWDSVLYLEKKKKPSSAELQEFGYIIFLYFIEVDGTGAKDLVMLGKLVSNEEDPSLNVYEARQIYPPEEMRPAVVYLYSGTLAMLPLLKPEFYDQFANYIPQVQRKNIDAIHEHSKNNKPNLHSNSKAEKQFAIPLTQQKAALELGASKDRVLQQQALAEFHTNRAELEAGRQALQRQVDFLEAEITQLKSLEEARQKNQESRDEFQRLRHQFEDQIRALEEERQKFKTQMESIQKSLEEARQKNQESRDEFQQLRHQFEDQIRALEEERQKSSRNMEAIQKDASARSETRKAELHILKWVCGSGIIVFVCTLVFKVQWEDFSTEHLILWNYLKSQCLQKPAKTRYVFIDVFGLSGWVDYFSGTSQGKTAQYICQASVLGYIVLRLVVLGSVHRFLTVIGLQMVANCVFIPAILFSFKSVISSSLCNFLNWTIFLNILPFLAIQLLVFFVILVDPYSHWICGKLSKTDMKPVFLFLIFPAISLALALAGGLHASIFLDSPEFAHHQHAQVH